MMRKNFLEGNKLRITLHILAWAILFGLPIYFIKRWQIGKEFIWFYYINNIISGLIFYSNYLLLVPSLFFSRKRYLYYLSVLILILSFYFVSDYSNKHIFKLEPKNGRSVQSIEPVGEVKRHPPREGDGKIGPPMREMHIFNYAFTSLILVFFSLGIRILERHSQIEKMQEKLEKERLNSELAFLKNQISPHFFFNTLNNIYSLISINTVDSQKAVLKLSKLMRYLLYESEHGNTSLSSELEFMNNYIDLMKLRMNEKVTLSVSFPVKYEEISIPPLIFIPFIENAFKHGISYRERSFIDISLTTFKDSLSFRCVNSLVKSKETEDNRYSGIGLENAGKRLALLFPGRHQLKINKSDSEYEVLLQISFAL
jgi:two-component system, LytTR family, sensor kinase